MPKAPTAWLFVGALGVLCPTFSPASEQLLKMPPKHIESVPTAVFNFDHDETGQPPKKFTLVATGEASTVQWVVQKNIDAPSRPNFLVEMGKGASDAYTLALLNNVVLDHGEVAVRFKILDEDEQSAGIVWRYQDPQNYYVIRASAKDEECSVYRMRKGKMKEVTSQAVTVSPYTWHDLRLVFVQNHFSALLDGDVIIGSKDTTFLEAGQIGLWSTGNSTVRFDDFRVTH